MHIKINFRKQKYITIDIFKENKEWFDFFKDLNDRGKYNAIVQPWSMAVSEIVKSNQIISDWEELKFNVNFLQNMGFKLPFSLSDQMPNDQKVHNDLHRIFTYSNSWILENFDLGKRKFIDNINPHPIDPNFIPQDIDKFLEVINNINILVHKTEYANQTDHKTFVRKLQNRYPDMYIWTQTHVWEDENTWFGKMTDDMNAIQYRYLDTNCNVIMSEEIQGKSYLRAFIDDDDPTKKDISGRYGSYGSFIIESSNNRKKIYESKQFNDWLKRYNLTKEQLQLEWPLGKVSYMNFDYRDKLYDKFISIEFLD